MKNKYLEVESHNGGSSSSSASSTVSSSSSSESESDSDDHPDPTPEDPGEKADWGEDQPDSVNDVGTVPGTEFQTTIPH